MGRMRGYCVMGIDFQLYKVKRIMGLDGNEGCKTLRMYLIALNIHLKTCYDGNFYVVYLTTKKKINKSTY